ncbi:hypothetical protein AB7M37_004760 [Sinorhizobium fredii]
MTPGSLKPWVFTGKAGSVLGDPLLAVVWLTQELAREGKWLVKFCPDDSLGSK